MSGEVGSDHSSTIPGQLRTDGTVQEAPDADANIIVNQEPTTPRKAERPRLSTVPPAIIFAGTAHQGEMFTETYSVVRGDDGIPHSVPSGLTTVRGLTL